jgi:hypothetical protein
MVLEEGRGADFTPTSKKDYKSLISKEINKKKAIPV